ncbi:MAG: ribose 5-phosphate isomerase A [Promethearchaeota archaeon]
MSEEKEEIEQAKKNAAIKAVEENLKNNMILGIGSGSTMVHAVKRIAAIARENKWTIKCIPTSFQAYQLIIENGLNHTTLDQHPIIDLDIDGADEIDQDLNLIKGGGGCLVQEKIVAYNSKKVIIVADYRKISLHLGENWKKGIPIEIIPMAATPILKKIEQLGGHASLRMARAKMGPMISDNGNFIIDSDFGIIEDPKALNEKLLNIPGVVDTGLFISLTSKAYIGEKRGNIRIIEKK